jgi:hypothetical protein
MARTVIADHASYPQDYWVTAQDGTTQQLTLIVKKEREDWLISHDTYRDIGGAFPSNVQGGLQAYVTTTSSPTPVAIGDEVAHLAPRFLISSETQYIYTNSTGAEFHINVNDFLRDGSTKPTVY